jgi:hypothetical protein
MTLYIFSEGEAHQVAMNAPCFGHKGFERLQAENPWLMLLLLLQAI